MIRKLVLIVVAVGAQLALLASVASAHVPDEYGHNTLVSITTDGIRIESQLTVGPLVGGRLVDLIDTDRDGTFSVDETRRYGQAFVNELAVTVDGTPRPVTLVRFDAPTEIDVRAGSSVLTLTAIAAGPLPIHEFTFTDNHRPIKGQAQSSLLTGAFVPPDVTFVRDIDRGLKVQGTFSKALTVTTTSTSSATPVSATETRTKRLRRATARRSPVRTSSANGRPCAMPSSSGSRSPSPIPPRC